MDNAAGVASATVQNPAQWRDHITTYGYVVVPGVLPAEQLQATVDDIWRHTGASPDDPDSWYRPDVVRPVGMVEMYQYQSMWNNRQDERVYDVFRAIHGTGELWVSIDRVGLKPPVDPRHPDYDHKGMIHWDTDITRYPDIPFHVQGVLALTDTEPDMGGFQCVPGAYQQRDEYLPTQSREQLESRNPDYSAYPVVKPRLAAGDLLIWTSLLLHGNGHNVSTKPRLCQYLSMNPAREQDEELRQRRISAWRENTHPSGRAFPGDARGIEEQRGTPAELTGLGRKLLGVDSWA
ncbi:MAG TPA: phytanoyl-CoA dioxygenase family protein [Mycobacteriales bacterium]|jgi:hypothetical protein|nr:phytanoyl-CoA dioxygenase family protein [Mycobacteriales bacterium]